MADIVQKSLGLQVSGEDAGAVDLFNSLSDQLTALEAKAQDVFGAIGMAGVDAMSALEDAANGFLAPWEDQLQAITEFAGGTFASLEASAASAGTGVADAAAPIAPAWQAASEKLTAAIDSAAGSVAASADKIETDIAAIDSRLSSLTGAADGAKGGISAALDGAAGAASTNGSKIAAALGDTAASVSTQVDKINGDLESISGSANGAAGAADKMPAAFASNLDKVSSSVATASGKVVGDLDAITTAADKAGLSLRLGGPGAVSTGAGAKAGAAGAGGVALLPGEKGAGAVSAAEEEKLLDRWLPKVSAVRTRVAAIGEELKGLEEKISGSANKLVTGGIVASILPLGAEASANFVEGLATTSKQTGLSLSNSWTLQSAFLGAGVKNPSQAIAAMARMEKRLHEGTTEITGPTSQTVTGQLNQPGNLKGGLNPGSVGIGVPNVQLARELAPFGLSAQKLFDESALQQLTDISNALHSHPQTVEWQNRASSLIQTLFGGRGGGSAGGSASMQLVLRDWEHVFGMAQKAPNPVAALGLPKNPLQAAEQARITGYSMETGLLTILTRLLPVMTKFTGGLEKFTNAILHPGWHTVEQAVTNPYADLIALWTGNKAFKGGKGILSALERIFGKGAGAGAASGEAGAAAEGAGAAGLATGALRFLGPEGAALAAIGSTAGWQLGEVGKVEKTLGGFAHDIGSFFTGGGSKQNLMPTWTKLVLPHVKPSAKFTSADTEKAIAEMAKLFGENAKAMLADSFAEAHLNPGAVNAKSGARGAFQFMPKTWAADTKNLLGYSLPQTLASNPYVAAFVAAGSMKAGGIGGQKSPQAALAQMLASFENPGGDIKNPKSPLGSDMVRGTSFLDALDIQLAKAASSAKTKAPQITLPVNQALMTLVRDAQAHGKEFTTSTDKSLQLAEHYLTTHKAPFTKAGRDLMQGLYVGIKAEEPRLLGEARSIANRLEAEIRAALQTHSPSEKTAAIGADVIAGFVLGMERGDQQLKTAAGKVASGVTGALGGATGSVAGGGSQTIIVQLDGREILRYVMQGMHQETKLLARLN